MWKDPLKGLMITADQLKIEHHLLSTNFWDKNLCLELAPVTLICQAQLFFHMHCNCDTCAPLNKTTPNLLSWNAYSGFEQMRKSIQMDVCVLNA